MASLRRAPLARVVRAVAAAVRLVAREEQGVVNMGQRTSGSIAHPPPAPTRDDVRLPGALLALLWGAALSPALAKSDEGADDAVTSLRQALSVFWADALEDAGRSFDRRRAQGALPGPDAGPPSPSLAASLSVSRSPTDAAALVVRCEVAQARDARRAVARALCWAGRAVTGSCVETVDARGDVEVQSGPLQGGAPLLRGRVRRGDGGALWVEMTVPTSQCESPPLVEALQSVLAAAAGLEQPGGSLEDEFEMLRDWMLGGGVPGLGELSRGGWLGLPGGERREVEGADGEGRAGTHADAESVVEELRGMGMEVVMPGKGDGPAWGGMQGYERQKRAVEETVLMALRHGDVYEEVMRGTRQQTAAGSHVPRAVLFEGPPGCGKTMMARVIASEAGAPLVHVPVEAVASKWYGQSEKHLARVFHGARSLGKCIVFLDEVDSLAATRAADMNEATRRLLGVLLRQIDGFSSAPGVVVLAATNRKADLDPALLSRFGLTVTFGLPDRAERAAILAEYARQLPGEATAELAGLCQGLSGRDLRSACEAAERAWASAIVRGEQMRGSLPGPAEYRAQLLRRLSDAGLRV